MKRPAYQWYPGDIRRDTALQACSFEARALWREMLDLMHDGEPYGHLTAGGVPIDSTTLARIVGVPLARVRGWLVQLEAHKVFSRTADGVIYSRRMLKDEDKRNSAADGGKLGGSRALGVDYNEPGFVYAMERRSDGAVKIGISKSPEKRRYRVERQFPGDEVLLLAKCWVSDMGDAESRLHQRFVHCHKSGEWFRLPPKERDELLRVHLKVKDGVNTGESPAPAFASAFASATELQSSPYSAAEMVLYDALPTAASRLAFQSEINARRTGMHTPMLTQAQIDAACLEYAGSGHTKNPNLRHFGGFLTRAATPAIVRPTTNAARPSKQDAGLAHLHNFVNAGLPNGE